MFFLIFLFDLFTYIWLYLKMVMVYCDAPRKHVFKISRILLSDVHSILKSYFCYPGGDLSLSRHCPVWLRIHVWLSLTPPQRLTHYCVLEDLKTLNVYHNVCSSQNENFLVILKLCEVLEGLASKETCISTRSLWYLPQHLWQGHRLYTNAPYPLVQIFNLHVASRLCPFYQQTVSAMELSWDIRRI